MKENLPVSINIPDRFFDEEVRSGYKVTEDVKKLWAVELDLLSEFDRVCQKHGIQYMACGGTLLGAIRHKGFIPWDDDIDIMMTYENYVKFRNVAKTEFTYPYFYQDGYTDKGSIRGHGQLRNSETTAIRKNEFGKKYPFNQGIFIDIFPLDNVPDDENEKILFMKENEKNRRRVIHISNVTYRYTRAVCSSMGKIKKSIFSLVHPLAMKLKLEEKYFRIYETNLHKYNDMKTEKAGITCLVVLNDRCFWETKDLCSELIYVPFEFLQIPVPVNYENILNHHYGNWHEYVIGKSTHGDLFIDVNNSYKKYL